MISKLYTVRLKSHVFRFVFILTINSVFSIGINFRQNGFYTAKSAINYYNAALPYHGASYSTFDKRLFFNDSNYLSLTTKIFLEEISREYDSRFNENICLKTSNHFGGKNSKYTYFKWNIKVGHLPIFTLSNGLTYKDYQGIGYFGTYNYLGFKYEHAIWGRGLSGYTDLWINRISYKSFPLTLTSLMEFSTGHYYDLSFKKKWHYLEVNLEGAILQDFDDDLFYAFLAGVDLLFESKKFHFSFMPEIRYYQHRFLPTPHIEKKHIYTLENYGKSLNNWIEYLDLPEDSFVYYIGLGFRYSITKNIGIFFKDELIFIPIDSYIGLNFDNMTAYKKFPSVNFYQLGIHYLIANGLTFDLLYSNRAQRSRYFRTLSSRYYLFHFLEFRFLWDFNFNVFENKNN